MDYLVRRYVVAAGDEAALSTALLAAGFTAFAFATRADGRLDLGCYGAGGALPAAVDAVCAAFPLVLSGEERRSEAELLSGQLEGQPCRLCDGVWIDPGDGLVATADRLVLRIPGSAVFGDGRHPSTRMAAGLVTAADLRDRRVIDLGCGTGVLGILAQHWGARSVLFSDLDPEAVAITAELAAANGVPAAQVLVSDLLEAIPRQPVDVILGNLYGDLCLRLLADPALDSILPRGLLVFAGIGHQRRHQVATAAVAAGFAITAEAEDGWWHALRCER